MLQPIELPDLFNAPPPADEAQALLREADERIDDFLHRRRGTVIHDFVCSDFQAVDAHLRWIVEQHLIAGRAFCEWGCGFGVIALLASLQNFDACGIDVQSELIQHAEQLAEDFGIPAQFAYGSLIPPGCDDLILDVEELAHIDLDTPSAYKELCLDLCDFDLVFGYPWPGHERFMEDVFDYNASDGALLLTYHGIEDLRLHRRVRGKSRDSELTLKRR